MSLHLPWPNAIPPRTGSYRIEAQLGRGGMGAVYRAVELGSGRRVALKTLEHATPRNIALFEREYHTLTSIKHPSVIEVFDFGIANGTRYYTMELLDGNDLSRVVPLQWRAACSVMRDVATSLSLLHARRLLHRDISPRNIRVAADCGGKLIDFGALADFGVARDIVGTPTCIAPECLQRVALDQRSDLFSLGVVTYRAITGRMPYAVTGLQNAQTAHEAAVAPPGTFVPGIPKALEQLVLAMISIDPLGRPASAAEVIERLSAIAHLPEAPLAGLAKSHLLRTALCGRKREMDQLSQALRSALHGQGVAVALEGPAGVGRSRLAGELLIDARMQGATTLRVEARAHAEPDGVIRELLRTLLNTLPKDAGEALQPYLPVLAQAFPDLNLPRYAGQLAALAPAPCHPAERRARIQNSFVQWVLAVAARKALVIMVDDLHAADSTSVGALIGLAHAARKTQLLLVYTLRDDAHALVVLQQLGRVATCLRLRRLTSRALGQLVSSAFGDVPNLARLAQWLYSVEHGNPAQSLDLLSYLIARGVIKYAGGAWSLPLELGARDLPQTLEQAMQERLRKLSPAALHLAQLLAAHQGDLSLTLCSQLSPTLDRSALFAALDELLVCDIVTASAESYRLRQDVLRELLLNPLSNKGRAALHRTLAAALLASAGLDATSMGHDAKTLGSAGADVLRTAIQAGWHLLLGGDDARADTVLRHACARLTILGDGPMEVVPVLEAILNEYQAQQRDLHEYLLLMAPLVLAGTYADFRLTYRYGEMALAPWLQLTGIDRAKQWTPRLGPHLSLGVFVTLTAVRAKLKRHSAAPPSVRIGFLGLIGIAAAIIGVAATLVDRVRCSYVLEQLSPLQAFPRSHAVRIAYDSLVAFTHAAFGRYGPARRLSRDVIARLRSPNGVRGLHEDARVQLELGALIVLGSVDANRTDGSVHEALSALSQIDSSVAQKCLAGARAAYHANRGERAQFERWQREVDVLAALSGSTWRQDVLIPRTLWWTHALCEDVMGLKHAARQLEAIAEEVPSLADTRDAALACYLAERGQHDVALRRFSQMFERTILEPTAMAMRFVGAYARILRKASHAEYARSVCAHALARLPSEEREFRVLLLGPQLDLALATAELGYHGEAVVLLERQLQEQASETNPLVCGLTHKARAQLALMQGNRMDFEFHIAAMRRHFQQSGNPALVAQYQRLVDEGQRLKRRIEASWPCR